MRETVGSKEGSQPDLHNPDPRHRPLPPGPRRRRLGLVGVPLLVFAGLAGLFGLALKSGDPSRLPSALLGRPAPQINLTALAGAVDAAGQPTPGFQTADLATGQVTIVNFWSSWCVPCVAEHPLLQQLGRDAKVRLFGVNYKDPEPGGRRFLGRYGNPFAAVGSDSNGRAAIEWGVYGMPETFVIDGQGRIIYKHVGELTLEAITNKLIPVINTARATAK
jgi:cytochrome c biogenesis protein CcmG, thiol:disulfide interchange protein DsbE